MKAIQNPNQPRCSICGCLGETHDDIYDCVEYTEVQNGIPKGQWLIDWAKRLHKKEKNKKDFSGFRAWSKKHS